MNIALLVESIKSNIKRGVSFVSGQRYFFFPLILLMGVYGVTWLAFYPGVMTPDSLDQWAQVLAGHYNNGSPYLSTIIMGMFRFIKDTPAWLGLVQVVLTALLFSVAIGYGHRKGVNRWVLIGVTVLAATSPIILLFSVTLWKDILYSVLVVAVCLLTAILVIEKSSHKYLYVILGLTISVVAVIRYNGIIYLILPLALLLLCNRRRLKPSLYLAGVSLGAYLVLSLLVPVLLRVDPAPMMTEWLRMKNVGAIYSLESPRSTQEQREIFEQVLPSKDWVQYYTCANPDGLGLKEENGVRHKYSDTLFEDAKQEQQWTDGVIAAALANPQAVIMDKICMANAFLQRKSPIVTDIAQAPGYPLVQEASKMPVIKKTLTKYVEWSHTPPSTTLCNSRSESI